VQTGSDYKPFIQMYGIPCLDIRYLYDKVKVFAGYRVKQKRCQLPLCLLKLQAVLLLPTTAVNRGRANYECRELPIVSLRYVFLDYRQHLILQ